jgi:hypothetical protein
MGLEYVPMKDRATQMGLEYITEAFNKPTGRDDIAFAHASRVSIVYQHWPKEAHEANQAKLPILRILF